MTAFLLTLLFGMGLGVVCTLAVLRRIDRPLPPVRVADLMCFDPTCVKGSHDHSHR